MPLIVVVLLVLARQVGLQRDRLELAAISLKLHITDMEIEGGVSGVTGVQLKPRTEEEPQHLPVEGVFIYVAGSKPITDFLENKVQFNDDGGVWVDEEMATTADGVYAIGDIRNTPFKQVVVAASDGCVAAMAIDKYLKGRKNFKVDWIHK